MTFKVQDHYFKKAKQENYLARSIYKLEEINQKYKVLKKGDLVLDLGYYPGSWIQYTSKIVGPKGQIIGVDIQEKNKSLQHLPNVVLYQKDAFALDLLEQVQLNSKVQVLLSDMAPSTTGIKSVDQARSLDLVVKIFEIMPVFLEKKGNVVIKVFEGPDSHTFLKSQKHFFEKMEFLRPKSTRSVSKEFFVIGLGHKA